MKNNKINNINMTKLPENKFDDVQVDGKILSFRFLNTNVSEVTALRNILIQEIPTLAFDANNIIINDNSTRYSFRELILNLSMIPVKAKLSDVDKFPVCNGKLIAEKNEDGEVNCFEFSAFIKNKSPESDEVYEKVYSDNIVASKNVPKSISLVYKNMYLFPLKSTDQIDFVMYATKGTSKDHANHSAVCLNVVSCPYFTFKNYEENDLLSADEKAKIEEFSNSTYSFKDFELFIEKNAQIRKKLASDYSTFKFSFESIGQYDPLEILEYAYNKLKTQFLNPLQDLDDLEKE